MESRSGRSEGVIRNSLPREAIRWMRSSIGSIEVGLTV